MQPFGALLYCQKHHQPPQRTVGKLRLLHHQHPDHPQGAAIDVAIRYLENRLPLTDYPHFRRQQIPIRPGIVESGHKVVMQTRMKQARMRWAEASLNPMLALCNQSWNVTWREIEAHVRHDKYAARKPVPPQVTDSCLVTVADCHRLTTLAGLIGRNNRQPWHDNRWIFPYRTNSLYQN